MSDRPTGNGLGLQLFDLTGTVCLVTGGSRGIGLGMARALAQAGANLVIWGRDAQALQTAREELNLPPDRLGTMVVDVSREAQVVDAMSQVVRQFGRIDTVFANAGSAAGMGPFENLTSEAYRNALSVNLDGVLWTLREACRHMKVRAQSGEPGGSIVAISSLSAILGGPGAQAYAAGKAAVIALIRATAVEYGRFGIRANAIVPGWIETPLTEAVRRSDRHAAILKRIPLKRWGTSADLGGLAIFLASRASAYHTGATFVVDGGYSIT